MLKKLKKIFNAVINEEQQGSYYNSLTLCEKCGCTLFPSEIMCPECLNPVEVSHVFKC